MRVPEMFSDHGMFMFLYALIEMAASVSNIIRIALVQQDLQHEHQQRRPGRVTKRCHKEPTISI